MFDNVGRKIKSMVTIITVIQMVAWSIVGIVLICLDRVLIGLLIAAIGCLIAWVSSLVLYGFGELVHKTSLIESYLRNGGALGDIDLEKPSKEESQEQYQLNPEFTEISEIPTDKRTKGSCDMCFKKTDVANCKIGDLPNNYTLCLNCINKYKAKIED